MNKKKVDSILKGVTAAGLTIGGVSSIQGADMVMAQMVESTASETTEMESDIEAASTSAETSQSITEQTTEIASESASQNVSENSTESISESLVQSSVELRSEADSMENDNNLKNYNSASENISVASYVSEVTYSRASDSEVNNSEYTSLQDVIEKNVIDSSKTVYQLGADKVLVEYSDGSGDVYYKTTDENIKKLPINAKAIYKDENGNVTVKFDGYYIDKGGVWRNTTFTDYNGESGNKVFINKHFVKEDSQYWKEVYVEIDGKQYPVEYCG